MDYRKNSRGKQDYRDFHDKNNTEIESSENVVFGRNAVIEALKSGREIEKIFIRGNEAEGSILLIIALAKESGIPIVNVAKEKLDLLASGKAHQGVCALVSPVQYYSVDEIFSYSAEKGEDPFIVIVDGVEDPHNLGAVIRSAECCGAHGLIVAKRRSSPVTATVVKSSAGAVEHLRICKVTNIAATIEDLKKKGIWVYGAEADGSCIYDTDLTGPAAFVVGSEGNGISRIVREKCDFIVSVPMYGKINSFNVSCASAIVFSEAARQRHKK